MEGMVDGVVIRTVDTTTTDPEGRTTATKSNVPVSGVRVAMVDFREAQTAAARGQTFDAVVAVPNAVWTEAFRPGVEVVVSGKGVPLDGTYRVETIRQTVLHRRVLMSRAGVRG